MAIRTLRPRMPRGIARALISAIVVLACSGYALRPSPFVTGELAEAEQQDLRMGYELLSELLEDTSRGTSYALKPASHGAPHQGISELMYRLSHASKKRATELSELRKRAPSVAATPAQDHANSDALSALAKDLRTSNMLSRNAAFDPHFVAAPAQAIRMIAAMAKATARFDPNRERRAWLKDLVVEYEGLLDDLAPRSGS